MPRPLTWTAPLDAELRRMRAGGESWDAIAASLGISRWAASERGRAVGARFPRRETVKPDALTIELENTGREPLRAGHPFTWALITAGTLLEGTDYPWPPLPVVKQ